MLTTHPAQVLVDTPSTEPDPLRVVVADDHPLYRGGIVRALEASGAFEVVGEASDGATALALIRDLVPDVAVLDVRMPGFDGIDVVAARRATAAVPGIPRDAEGPVFREPWEAQAFAMTLALHERGLFSWPEWAATLGEEIKRAQAAGDPDTGETYYRHWLNALERIVAARGLADTAMLARYRRAWHHAADRTPHGTPIELRPDDFAD